MDFPGISSLQSAKKNVGQCISRYAGNEFEGLPELFAATTLGLTEPHAQDEGLPRNTIGLDPENPPSQRLRQHLDDIMASVLVGQLRDSYYSPPHISPESYGDGE